MLKFPPQAGFGILLATTFGCQASSSSLPTAGARSAIAAASKPTFHLVASSRVDTALGLAGTTDAASVVYATETQVLNALEASNAAVVQAAKAEAKALAAATAADLNLAKAQEALSAANASGEEARAAAASAAAAAAKAQAAEANAALALSRADLAAAQGALAESRAQAAADQALQALQKAQQAFDKAAAVNDAAAQAIATAQVAQARADNAAAQAALAEAKAQSSSSAALQAQASANAAQATADSALEKGNAAQAKLDAMFARQVSVKSFGAKGDGISDDTVAIQSALDSLPGGGIVHLPKGLYRLNAKVVINASNVVLSGEPGSTLLDYGVTGAANTSLSDLTVRNLKIDMRGRASSVGVLFRSLGNATFENVHVVNAGQQVNTYTKSDANGGFGFILYDSSNVTLRGCTAKNIAGGGNTQGDAFYCANSKNIAFENCVAEKVGRHAFASTDHGGTASSGLRFSDCRSIDTALSGIDLEPGAQVSIRGHQFKGCGTFTGYYDPTAVWGNAYRLRAGVALTQADNDIIVDGCSFEGGYYGITFGNFNSNLIVSNCLFRSTTADAISQGGLAQGGAKVKVSNNIVYGRIGGMYGLSDCDVTNNSFIGDGTGAGIDLSQCNRVSVAGNSLYNFVTGASIRQSTSPIAFENNRVFGCTTPIALYASGGLKSNVVIRGNYVSTEANTNITSFSPFAIRVDELTGANFSGVVSENVIAGYSRMFSGNPGGLLTRLNSSKSLTTSVQSSLDSGFRTNVGVAQTIAANSASTLNFDTVEYDRVGEFSSATRRWTASYSGQYQFNVTCQLQNPQTSERVIISLWKNGTTEYRLLDATQTTSGPRSVSGALTLNLSAGDYVEARILSSTGNVVSPGTGLSWFTGSKLL